MPAPLIRAYRRLIAVIMTVVLAVTGVASAPHAVAKPPSPADIARCEAETAAYNAAWANGWAATNNKPVSQAPPPPVPYKCGPVPDDPVVDDTPALPDKPDAPAINIPQLPDRDTSSRPTVEPGKPGGGITRPSEENRPLNNKDGSPRINPKEGDNSDEDKEGIDRRPPLDEATLNRVASALERMLEDPENAADNASKTDKGMDEWRGVQDYLMSQEEWEERCKEEQRVAEKTAQEINHEVAKERERIRKEREAEAYRQWLIYQQWVAQVEAENAAAAAAKAPPKGGNKPSPQSPNSKPQGENPKPRPQKPPSSNKPPKDDNSNSGRSGGPLCVGPCQTALEHPEAATAVGVGVGAGALVGGGVALCTTGVGCAVGAPMIGAGVVLPAMAG